MRDDRGDGGPAPAALSETEAWALLDTLRTIDGVRAVTVLPDPSGTALRVDLILAADAPRAHAATEAARLASARLGRFVAVADMTPEQWSETIDTNLTGVFHVCHATIPELRKRGGGYIINISSLAGKNAFVGAGALEELVGRLREHDPVRIGPRRVVRLARPGDLARPGAVHPSKAPPVVLELF